MAGESGTITVFGSSRPREGDADYEQARALGRELAARGFRVCSGGYGGVMEAASRGAKESGGRTLAVTAKFFESRANVWVDEVHAVATWQERLFELIRLGEIGARFRMASKITAEVVPENACRPVAIS